MEVEMRHEARQVPSWLIFDVRQMKKPFAAFTIACVVGSTAVGCSCSPPPPPLDALKVAYSVFVGVPRSVRQLSESRKVFEFEVVEGLKGDLKSKVSVVTGIGNGDCGIPFSMGQRYLVYADRSEKQLSAHLCSRTTMLFNGSHDGEIDLLRKAKK